MSKVNIAGQVTVVGYTVTPLGGGEFTLPRAFRIDFEGAQVAGVTLAGDADTLEVEITPEMAERLIKELTRLTRA